MLRADPGSTCILSIYMDPMYPVQYKGLSCRLSMRSMSSGVKVMHGICCCTRWHWGHEAPSYVVGMGTCVRNDSKSARASLSASLVSFERRSSSCRVIRAEILANCPNTSKREEVLSPWEGFFFKDTSKRISFCFFFIFRRCVLDWCSGSSRCWLGYSVTYLVILS